MTEAILSDAEIAEIAKREEQARITREAMEAIARDRAESAAKKNKKRLPSTVRSSTDPRHGDGGVTVEDKKLRGYAVHVKSSAVEVPSAEALSVAVTHGPSRGNAEKEVE